MEKVSGIGGFFFRARDPVAIGRWYRDHLGVGVTEYVVDLMYPGQNECIDDSPFAWRKATYRALSSSISYASRISTC